MTQPSQSDAMRGVLDRLIEKTTAAEERAAHLEDERPGGLDHPTVAEAYGIVEGLEQAQAVVRKAIADA